MAESSSTAEGRRKMKTAISENFQRKAETWRAELKRRLELLDGLVFVEGEFEQSADDAVFILTRKFSTGSLMASFRMRLPRRTRQTLPTM